MSIQVRADTRIRSRCAAHASSLAGDQLRYHSHFTLTVLSTPSTTIMPLDIVAYGRLATAVKKAHLLASWDADKQQVVYASLEWAAFG